MNMVNMEIALDGSWRQNRIGKVIIPPEKVKYYHKYLPFRITLVISYLDTESIYGNGSV